MTFGQAYLGADNAPDKIRKAGLHSILKNLGWRLNDLGDLKVQPPTDRDPGTCEWGWVNACVWLSCAGNRWLDYVVRGRYIDGDRSKISSRISICDIAC